MTLLASQDTLVTLLEPHSDFVWAVEGFGWVDGILVIIVLLVVGSVARQWIVRRRRGNVGN